MRDAYPLFIGATWWEDGTVPTKEEIDRFVSGDRTCLIAYCKGIPAGIIVTSYHSESLPGYIEFSYLFVDVRYRGCGVANRLIREAVSLWEYDGETPVCITTSGQPREFYKSMGFVETHSICASTLSEVTAKVYGKSI